MLGDIDAWWGPEHERRSTQPLGGQRLLKNVEVSAVIAKAREAQAKRTEVTADAVIGELNVDLNDARQRNFALLDQIAQLIADRDWRGCRRRSSTDS